MASTTISTISAAGAAAKSTGLGDSTATIDDTKNNPGQKAIASCMRSWNYAYSKLAEDDDSAEYQCERAGNKAYLNAVPPLSGHQNICDFIACINYASMAGVVTHKEATHYLANARIALAALSLRPKPQATGAKSGGKLPVNSAKDAEE
ncbi:MAG: hypothetical protein ABSE36_01650 [Terracidiphilus sp.]|jgi:hypothetical protein